MLMLMPMMLLLMMITIIMMVMMINDANDDEDDGAAAADDNHDADVFRAIVFARILIVMSYYPTALSGDRKLLASASHDNTIKVTYAIDCIATVL